MRRQIRLRYFIALGFLTPLVCHASDVSFETDFGQYTRFVDLSLSGQSEEAQPINWMADVNSSRTLSASNGGSSPVTTSLAGSLSVTPKFGLQKGLGLKAQNSSPANLAAFGGDVFLGYGFATGLGLVRFREKVGLTYFHGSYKQKKSIVAVSFNQLKFDTGLVIKPIKSLRLSLNSTFFVYSQAPTALADMLNSAGAQEMAQTIEGLTAQSQKLAIGYDLSSNINVSLSETVSNAVAGDSVRATSVDMFYDSEKLGLGVGYETDKNGSTTDRLAKLTVEILNI